jgi:hypothetical protein
MSSSEDYSLNFRRMKEGEEKMPLNMADLEWEEYNEPYKMEELEYALQNCNGSSPGSDGIHYKMLKKLSLKAKEKLLKGYNQVWEGRSFPEEWTGALVVSVLKPGKDKSSVASYRPKSLTSCVCKLFEKMLNNRLENRKVIP